ncbi:hypothetical protein V8F20_001234 [Naviculisporaceae sp. PSN 640]
MRAKARGEMVVRRRTNTRRGEPPGRTLIGQTVLGVCSSGESCPRFYDTVRKCLQCDFNYGFDLNGPHLQKAVYEKLVTPLEGMIASMSLDENAYG